MSIPSESDIKGPFFKSETGIKLAFVSLSVQMLSKLTVEGFFKSTKTFVSQRNLMI